MEKRIQGKKNEEEKKERKKNITNKCVLGNCTDIFHIYIE